MEQKLLVFLVVNLAVSAAVDTTGAGSIVMVNAKDDSESRKDLLHDDIIMPPNQRSTIIGDINLWTPPVPFLFDKSVDIHTKGIILRALDQFRLKSCIDFKQRDAEEYYLSIQKLNGCYSYIGRTTPNGQVLSLGYGCEHVYIVEHEMLHALGFFHEQSRYDRDDYVTIVWDNILKGREHNFNKVPSDESTTHGTPYDYWSVMHYSKDAFTNGNGSTIITIDPKFQDIIGQDLEMSNYDVQELNLLYKCNSTIAFNMYCDFSNGTLCGMDRCSQGSINWELVTQVTSGPSSDHTTLPSGSKNYSGEVGYFMHVSTATGQEGDTAQLETQRMIPKRDCHIQCLQFYYYHSGNESDVLNIWIREFENEQDLTGARRLMGQITGSKTSHWRLHHVSLNATKNFQVVFEVRKGAGRSTGGFSVDDINLHETECPHLTLQIDDFQTVLENTRATIYSARQYSNEGYGFRFGAFFFETQFGLYMQLLSGDYDDQLEWPCLRRQVTFQMLDQTPNIQQQMAKRWTFTTNEYLANPDGVNYFDNPRKIGSPVFTDENNQQVYGGVLYSPSAFSTLQEMQKREFLKGGSAVFTLNLQDLTPLVNGSTLQCPQVRQMKFVHQPTDGKEEPCSWNPPVTTPSLPDPETTVDDRTPPAKTTTPPSIIGTPPPPIKTTPSLPDPPTTIDDRTPPAKTTTSPSIIKTPPSIITTPSPPDPPTTVNDRTPPEKTTTSPTIIKTPPPIKTTPSLPDPPTTADDRTPPAKTTTSPSIIKTPPTIITTPSPPDPPTTNHERTPPAKTTTPPIIIETPPTIITTPSPPDPPTTDDDSIFNFSPNMKPSAILICLLTVIRLVP
ncbi:hypothetical protein OJAV_G00162030 [Oryzias javanicus]|uniref:Metalloendopeptidase n=1 Tax=Oryzias javanicus TaxID=123683 RepID=A0A3S2U517_ORYJA|nr:hypothetical protein OJAV_G00162030 [Oryzias javanicus]